MIKLDVLLIDLVALLIIAWVVQLVRRDRLYVGYGVIFVIAFTLGIVTLTVPSVLGPLNALSGLFLRSTVLASLVLAFILLLLIHIVTQLTILAKRVTLLTQELAIREAISRPPPGPDAARGVEPVDLSS